MCEIRGNVCVPQKFGSSSEIMQTKDAAFLAKKQQNYRTNKSKVQKYNMRKIFGTLRFWFVWKEYLVYDFSIEKTAFKKEKLKFSQF